MGSRRRTAVLATGGIVMASFTFAGTAHADAGHAASCLGIEASSVSPPGTTSEFPGGMADLLPFLRTTFPDTSPGTIVAGFAALHAGSHEACDEAAG